MTADVSVGKRTGNVKATRADWIDAARSKLDSVAIDELKILTLAEDLSVSRSSFYWYFSGMAELQNELVKTWGDSTEAIVERSHRPTDTITTACLGVFECWADTKLSDPPLEFAIRDWGRRNTGIAERVHDADIARLEALAAMFGRHGFSEMDAMVRARLLYHSQLGYYLVGTNETTEMRLMFLPSYLVALTGEEPTAEILAAFSDYFRELSPSG